MKRKNNLYNKIFHRQNILDAFNNSKKGKSKYKEVIKISQIPHLYINKIHNMLINKSYKTSEYKLDKRIERGKERIIYKLPYFPDRIIHHTLLQIIQPILEQTYIKDTYQSIKGRGVHKAKDRLEFFLKDVENTKYCFKMDIKKYYPSIDNQILKKLIRKKIKCEDILYLIDEIIDSTKGLPIGNYTSQTFGNYYLSYFDHWIKEDLRIKYYIRYADDMVILHSNKSYLHEIKTKIEKYLEEELHLKLKENWQIFPTRTRGIDFLGFRFFGTHTIIRKSIKKSFVKISNKIKHKTITIKNIQSFMSYYGWIKASDSYNLLRTSINKQVKQKFKKICDIIKIKNPIRNLIVLRKKNINEYGNFQPNLFNFN